MLADPVIDVTPEDPEADNVPADKLRPAPTFTLENPPVPLLAKSCAELPVVAGA
jgi:hypothetical protein